MRLVLVLVVLVGVLAGAAWLARDPGPLHRIVVSSNDGTLGGFWQIAIDDRDHYSLSTPAWTRRGTLRFAPFARRLAAVAEIRWLPPNPRGGDPGETFWIEGRRRTVAPFVYGAGAGHPALRGFAAALHNAVLADLRRRDAPRRAALTRLDGLRALRIEADGAMCFACRFTLAVSADGRAALETHESSVAVHAARLSWAEVVRILREARLGDLDARYGTAGESDYWGARFSFAFAHGTQTIDAPNVQTWPPALRRAFARLILLVDHGVWKPALGPRAVPNADYMRTWAVPTK